LLDDAAKTLYQQFQFAELPGHPYRLFLSPQQLVAMAELAQSRRSANSPRFLPSQMLYNSAPRDENQLMAMFVHLALESQVPRIIRNGIRCSRRKSDDVRRGVFAVPVTRNFYVSHQWLRELKRRSGGTIAAVYFRIPDEEQVWMGHYNQSHRWLTAAEASAQFMSADDAQGWEVIIPHRIDPDAIHRTRRLPQVMGWRFWPNAKGKRPFCPCKFCTRGEYGARRLRERLGSPDD
jgi:hypothetical protein